MRGSEDKDNDEWITKIQEPMAKTNVEQVVVYSTLPQEYYTLTFRGEVVANGGGVEERSEVMYCIERDMIIYYRMHNSHSCIA